MIKFPFRTISLLILMCSYSSLKSQDIFTALMHGDTTKVKELLQADSANAVNKNSRGFYPVHFAANFKQLEMLKLLYGYGASLHEIDVYGRQTVHWAAAVGDKEMLCWLYKEGADLNVRDKSGKTPLFFSVTRGSKETTEFLLNKKVDVFIDGEASLDFLYKSTEHNYDKIIETYLQSDFDFKQAFADGTNLLFAAARNKNVDLIKRLVKSGLDVNSKNDYWDCPLLIAIESGNVEAVKTLLALGANINVVNYLGENTLVIAERSGNIASINYLKSVGAHEVCKTTFVTNYPAYSLPQDKVELYAPGIVSTRNMDERDAMFSRDYKEFYFGRYSRSKQSRMIVKKMKQENNQWSYPDTASFSKQYGSAECFVNFDNNQLYFISQRSTFAGDDSNSWNIWRAIRKNGEWVNFHLVSDSLKGCFYPSLTKGGELLYTSPDNNLYLAKYEKGIVSKIEKLRETINTPQAEYNAMISPEGDYIIFTSTGFEDTYGGGDLYISFKLENNRWSKAINLGSEINTAAHEYCPNLSPDGKFFFFCSDKKGNEDIYWISANFIDSLKKQFLIKK